MSLVSAIPKVGSLLLQHVVMNLSIHLGSDSMSSNMKAEYAFEVWVETQSIQDALDIHVCNLDTGISL
jgi:hypothetical protein